MRLVNSTCHAPGSDRRSFSAKRIFIQPELPSLYDQTVVLGDPRIDDGISSFRSSHRGLINNTILQWQEPRADGFETSPVVFFPLR